MGYFLPLGVRPWPQPWWNLMMIFPLRGSFCSQISRNLSKLGFVVTGYLLSPWLSA